jgi:hypothetical protein
LFPDTGHPPLGSCDAAVPGASFEAERDERRDREDDGQDLAAAWFHLRHLGATATHAPAPDAARFTGRFASLWGVTDVAALDGRLFALDPTAPQPAEDAVPLEVIDDRTLLIAGGRSGNSYGERMRYEFAPDGTATDLRGESGMTSRPFVVRADV